VSVAGVGVVAWGLRVWVIPPGLPSNAELIRIAEEAVPPRWDDVADASPVFDTVFIQPDREAGWEDPERRRADLQRAADRGARTLVVQYLAHGADSLLSPRADGGDEPRDLLDDAARLGLDVWLGTREDPAIWETTEVSLDVWSSAAAGGVDVARRIAGRYGDHAAFTGWYWTPEAVWAAEPDARRLVRLARITRRAVRALRDAADKPVAVPLGATDLGWTGVYGGAWCRYAEISEADRIVAMDGVGTAHLDVAHLGRFYGALRGCAETVGFELVADIEAFGPGIPPAPTRLERQLVAAMGFAHRRAVFDLGHYLQPGSEGAAFWADPAGPPATIDTAEADRDDRGARIEVARPAARIDVLTQPPHPTSVELYAILDRGDAQYLGSPLETHGPGRYHRTWLWRPPEGSEPVREFEVVLRGEKTPGPWEVLAVGD